MDKQLKILLDKINIDDKPYKECFLTKIIVDDEKDTLKFLIESPIILPVEDFKILKEAINNSFKDVSKVSFEIAIKKIDYEKMVDYLGFTLLNMFDIASAYREVKREQITFNGKKLIINASSLLESNRLSKHINRVKSLYEHYGFKGCKALVSTKEVKLEYNESKDALSAKVERGMVFGTTIKTKPVSIKEVLTEMKDVTIDGKIFGADFFESNKSNYKIITLKVTDYSDSIYVKIFTQDTQIFNSFKQEFKEGNWFRFKGYVKYDDYSKDIVVNAKDIMAIEGIKQKDELRFDAADIKRVELHAHTNMSQMDGLVKDKDLINKAIEWGHKAIAITDHNSVQSFPTLFHMTKDIKGIYGVELSLIDDDVDIVLRENDMDTLETTYVVFDFETTGFNAGGSDSIIEIGAVKLKGDEIIDTYSELIDPKVKLSDKIVEITGITDEMLKGKRSEEEGIKDFIKWFGDLPMVAHNAKFDASFLESCYKKYDLGEYKNMLIDTLTLSRVLDSNFARHGLAAITKRYKVELNGHHRAVNDSEATAMVYNKMLRKMYDMNIEKISDINKMVSKDDLYKVGTLYHIILLAQNNKGLKNLFEILSLANTKYLHKTPRILRSEVERLRKGILIGSACANGEVFEYAKTKTEEELSNVMSFYDYIEVQPSSLYDHLVQLQEFNNIEEVKEVIKKIINVASTSGKDVVATGDVHHLYEKDKIYREIVVNQKVPGGGLHPLKKRGIHSIPSKHFMTTNEMIEAFDFIDNKKAFEIVVTNSNKIADSIENVKVIKDDLYVPKIENSQEIVSDMVYKKAKSMYGEKLPEIVEKRINTELSALFKQKMEVVYLLSQKLVKKSNDDGYIVGSRGSVGSSFVATMMGITEVNPLPAHYYCPNCQTSIFEKDGESFGVKYSSGYDLPDKKCTCGTLMVKEGNDMPFETFLGFNGDKVPDIDLNFSGDYQSIAHDYTKELVGEDKAFRAGTIGTVAEKTAIGFVLGYAEDNELSFRRPEVERLALGCTGVKRTTGQHPGGIIILNKESDITDFTPYQYPADDKESVWYTTHFDYHSIEDNVLKLDILGHDDPTMLRQLQDSTGKNLYEIPFDDKDVMKLFNSCDVLGVAKEKIKCTMGTLGIPEFGTSFVIDMLEDTHPKTFAELLKVSGLSHGTDVWMGNAQELIRQKVCPFKDVIGCRDDIMVYLMYQGMDAGEAFKIMEVVRKKGKYLSPQMIESMKNHGVPKWYIEACDKIKYMFPKAHATAYVMMALRVAWFKVHMPIYYYSAYFSIRCHDFDINAMIKGYDGIKDKMEEIEIKGYEATNKEQSIKGVLHLALEMTARGFGFEKIDLLKSDSDNFIIVDNKLIPPFRTIDGLGDIVAKKIIAEREKAPFLSIEDLKKRARVSNSLIDEMRIMGILEGLPESSQLSLF